MLQAKERSRSEHGEEKKLTRLLTDMKSYLEVALSEKSGSGVSAELRKLAAKLKESRDELEQLHKLNEEERASAKRGPRLPRAGTDSFGSMLISTDA